MSVIPSIAAGYLKNRKRHTILTEAGIILSVVLMTMILIGVSTVMTTMKNITTATDGSYDVIFNELSKDDALLISNMQIFDKTYIYSISSYTELVTSELDEEYPNVRYIADRDGNLISDTFLRFGEGAMDMLPTEMTALSEGRMPTKDGEIVLSEADRRDFGDLSVGDTFELIRYEVVNKGTTESADTTGYNVPAALERNYTVKQIKPVSFEVVGISSDYSILPYSDTLMSSFIPQKDKLIVSFDEHQNDFYWDLHYVFMGVGLEINDFDYAFNQQYLNMVNKGAEAHSYNAIFYMLVYLVVLFIMFCVRMVIDSCFEIASHERIRQYGVLRAVGASKKQIMGLLVSEALLLSAVGVPVGLLGGTGAAYLIFKGICGAEGTANFSTEYDLPEMAEFSAPVWIFISAALIGVFWVLISAVGTGVRVNKYSPVEAMKATSRRIRLRKPEKKAKEGRAGVEWLLAFRSVRRNNKRFIITLVSMTISIVLFAGFSYAMEVVKDHFGDIYSDKTLPYDYELNLYDLEPEDTAREALEMEQSGFFRNVQYDSHMTYFVQADEKINKNESISGYYPVDVHPISETTYKKLTGKDDYADFAASEGFIIDGSFERENDTYELFTADPTGSKVTAAGFADYSSLPLQEFEIYGTYDTDIELYSSVSGRYTGCIAQENYEKKVMIYGIDTASVYQGELNGQPAYLHPRTIYADAADDHTTAVRWLDKHYFDYYTDHYTEKNTSYAMLELVKICGTFLIILFSLIAAVNIINIISENVLNRTAEIAMLRACGMSPVQVYKMIFSESVLIAGIASISAALVIEGMIIIIYLPFYLQLGNIFRLSDMPVTLSLIDPIKYLVIGAAAAFAVGAASAGASVSGIIKTPIVNGINAE